MEEKVFAKDFNDNMMLKTFENVCVESVFLAETLRNLRSIFGISFPHSTEGLLFLSDQYFYPI